MVAAVRASLGAQVNAIIQWTADNVEWLFSGIGISALSALAVLLRKRSSGTKQIATNSKNVTQIGGDVTVTNRDD